MFKRGLVLVLVLLGNICNLGAVFIDGTSNLKYFPQNYVFRDGDSAEGFVRFGNGITVKPSTGYASNFTINTFAPLSGGIDLRTTSMLTLLGDLKIDNNITFTNGGYINSAGSQLVLGGDLTIAQDKDLHLGGVLTVDGNGHNFSINPNAKLLLDDDANITLRNMTLSISPDYYGYSPIQLGTSTTRLNLDNVDFKMGKDFNFNEGQLHFYNNVQFSGPSTFAYNSASPSYIAPLGRLSFAPDTTFLYAPSSPSRDLLVMEDKTSTLFLDGCTLKTSNTGMRLTNGSLCFGGNIDIINGNNVRVRERTSGAGTGTYALLDYTPNRCEFSPDGLCILTTLGNRYQYDGIINLHAIENNKLVLKYKGNPNGAFSVTRACTWSPDSGYIAILTSNNIYILKIINWTPTWQSYTDTPYGTPISLRSFAWSPTGEYIAATNSDNGDESLNIYPVSAGIIGTAKSVLTGSGSYPLSCSWSPDGKYVSVVCRDANEIKIYAISSNGTPSLVDSASAGTSPQFVSWSPKGDFIAVVNAENDLLIFPATSSGSLGTVSITTTETTPKNISWAPSGDILAVACAGIEIHGEGSGLNPLLRVYSIENGIAVPNENQDIGVGSGDMTWCSWQGVRGNLIATINDTSAAIYINKVGYQNAMRTLSDCIIIGNGSQSQAADVDIRLQPNAQVNVNGLIYDNSINQAWQNRYTSDTEVNTTSYTLESDLFLDDNHRLLINESCTFDGAGHSISFAQNSGGIYLAPGKMVKFTNVVFKDFYDYAISSDDTSYSAPHLNPSITFGDGTIIEIQRSVRLGTFWKFSGNVTINGFGNTISIYDDYYDNNAIGILSPGTLTLQNIKISGVKKHKLRCIGENAEIKLNNCDLILDNSYNDETESLDNNYRFTSGSIIVENDVKLTGKGIFSQEGTGNIIVLQESTLFVDSGITYSYAADPIGSESRFIFDTRMTTTMTTATLYLNGCSLKTTDTGMRLRYGNIYFDNTVTISTKGPLSDPLEVSAVDSITRTFDLSNFTYNNGAWSPNGSYIVVTDSDSQAGTGHIELFSVSNGQLTAQNTQAVPAVIDSCAWSPNNQYVSIATDNGINVYAITSGMIGSLVSSIDSGNYQGITWSGDGSYIAVIEKTTKLLYIYPVANGVLGTPQSASLDLFSTQGATSWSPNSGFVAVSYVNQYSQSVIKTFSVVNGAPTFVSSPMSPLMGSALGIKWSPAGGFIAVVCSGPNNLIIYPVDNNGIFEQSYGVGISYTISLEASNLYGFSWSPDGSFIAITKLDGSDYTLNFYAIANGVPSAKQSIPVDNGSLACLWNNNGSYLATLYTNESWGSSGQPRTVSNGIVTYATNAEMENPLVGLTLIDSITSEISWIGSGSNRCAWSPNNSFIAAIDTNNSGDSNIHLLAVSNGQLTVQNTQAVSGNIGSCAWAPNDQYFAVATDQGVKVYPISGGLLGSVISSSPSGTYQGISWSHDGNYIAAVFIDQVQLGNVELHIFTVTNGVLGIPQSLYIENYANQLFSTWSPDGSYVAVSYSSMSSGVYVKTYTISLGTPTEAALKNITGMMNAPSSIEWSPTGDYVAFTDESAKTLNIYPVDNNGTLGTGNTISLGTKTPRRFSWTADGNFIAVMAVEWGMSGEQDTLNFYAIVNGVPSLIDSITITTGTNSCSWNGDGSYIATTHYNMMSNSSGLETYSFDYNPCITQADSIITEFELINNIPNNCSWSPFGSFVAIIENDIITNAGTINLYAVNNGQLTARNSKSGFLNIQSCAWAPNGNYFAVATALGIQVCNITGGIIGDSASSSDDAEYQGISWSADGDYIAAINKTSRQLRVFPVEEGILGTPQDVELGTTSLDRGSTSWRSNGSFVAASYINSDYKTFIKNFSVTDGVPSAVFSTTSTVWTGPLGIKWSPSADFIAIVNTATPELTIYPVDGQGLLETENTISLGTVMPTGFNWAPNGNFISVSEYVQAEDGDKDPFLKVFSLNNGVPLLTGSIPVSTAPAYPQAFSWNNDGSYIAATYYKGAGGIARPGGISASAPSSGIITYAFSYDLARVRELPPTLSNSITFSDTLITRQGGSKIKVYGLVDHRQDSYSWQTRNQFGKEINTSSYSQNEDLFLSKDQSLIINESCVFNGDGHSIWFARNQLNLIQIAAGKSVVFTNVVLKDFNDAAIFLGTGSVITFGDGSVIEYSMPTVLSHDLQFAGNAIIRGLGYSIDLSTHYLGIRQPGLLTLQDIVFNNVDDHKIRCIGDNASIVFRNSDLVLDGNFTFSTGSFTIQDDVIITGTHTFSFEGSGQKTSRIAANSTLLLDTGVTFSYAPRAANQDLLAFTNVTSRLYLNGCTLKTTSTGMRLTKGTMIVDNQNSVYNNSPSSMSGAFTLGNGIAADDLTIQIMPNANIEMVNGSMVYNNQQ